MISGLKNQMRNMDDVKQAAEGPKSWNSMSHICQKKYIHSAKTLYTEDLSNITFNCCVRIHQIPYVIFETISHFSRQNSSVLFYLKHYILLTKIFYQSANFLIFHCSS